MRRPKASHGNRCDSTVANDIRLVKAKIAKLEQLAELRALEERLKRLADKNGDDRFANQVSGDAGGIIKSIRKNIVNSPEQASSARRARSPSSDVQGQRPIKRQRRYETELPDFEKQERVPSSSAKVPIQPTKARFGLQPADIEWLGQNLEQYRGLGTREDAISWADLLADNKDLAERMTAKQCAHAWMKHNIRVKQETRGRARLQPEDIQWLHAHVEQYRGLAGNQDAISWKYLLQNNKDLEKRMSAHECAVAWHAQLEKEKNRRSRKMRKERNNAVGGMREDGSDGDIEL